MRSQIIATFVFALLNCGSVALAVSLWTYLKMSCADILYL